MTPPDPGATPAAPGQLGTGRGWPPLLFALALGAGGGALFWRLGLPLPWMLGAMTATTAAAVGGIPLRIPVRLRLVMVVVLGVMLGSAFSPALLDQLGAWSVSLAALVPYLLVATLLSWAYFRRVGGYDATTAYYAGVPGGLAEMIVLGGNAGGDSRAIALAHATRILLVVFTIPFWFRLTHEMAPVAAGAAGPGVLDVGLADLAWLALAAVAGALAGHRLRLPSAMLVGPMIASAAIHLCGLTSSRPPLEAVALAQIVLGTAIGCRFAGTGLAVLGRAVLLALGALIILLAVAVAFALAVGRLTGLDFDALLLAYAPGGLAEMSLIALAQQIDPAFVAAHHTVRIALVVTLAPLLHAVMVRTFRARGRGP